MLLSRQSDATQINGFLNHPEVYPTVAGPHKGPFDIQPLIDRGQVMVLAGEFGGFLVYNMQPKVYGFHTAVLPEGRGRWAARLFIDGLQWVFTRTDAVELMTHRPHGNIAAKAALKMAGAIHDFTTRPIWPVGEAMVQMDVYSFRIQEWAKTAPGMIESGKWFHGRLAEKTAGSGRINHKDDELHDRYVGIAIEMIRNGHPDKGVGFYNRWAVMAGYLPSTIMRRDPLTINIGDATIVVGADDFEVIDANRGS